jgi:hypothetical protein
MVSKVRGLEFKPQPRIPMHVIIPTYRSPYDWARVAQISESGALAGTR